MTLMQRDVAALALSAASLLACSPGGPPAAVATDEAPAALTLAAAPDRFASLGYATIRYRDLGEGPAVVLIHGFSRSLEDWAGTADSLALDHRVIALDLRGAGMSTTFTDPARYGRAMADDIIRLLDDLGIDRGHLAGHSMGALVAANVAMRHPARVASATLVAGPFHADSASLAEFSAPTIADIESGEGVRDLVLALFPGMPDSVAAELSAQTMAANDADVLVAILRSTGALLADIRAANATVPALVAAGTEDPLLPFSRDIAGRWPGARLLIAQGANHLTIIASPDLLEAMRAIIP
jgi:pimeloyl-ACP methyl ester carboxylesterase